MSRIPQLEEDLVAAAGRLAERRRVLPSGRPMVAVAVAGMFAAAAGAGAASGLLKVGSVIPGGERSGAGSQRVEQIVIATSSTPVSGRWQMTSFVENGEQCLQLKLLDSGQGMGTAAGSCGYGSTFTAASSGTVDDAEGSNEILVYGRAPEQATTVELTAKDGQRITSKIHEGPPSVAGDFYLIAAPSGHEYALINWMDEQGIPSGDPIDLAGAFKTRPPPNSQPTPPKGSG